MAPPGGLSMVLLTIGCLYGVGAQYYGADLGPLSQLHHGVKGRVYAVDARTLYIKDFHFDGEGPAAHFYVGSSKSPHVGPGSGAVKLRDERGSSAPLRRYRGEGVALALPEGTALKDIRWLSVWCEEFSVNFGDVRIPPNVEYPRPVRVGALRGVHGVRSDPVVLVDSQTLLVPNFSYDGEAPDAKFWVGRGETPSPQGIRIPDENGKEAPLRRYDRKTIVLTLPGELTVFDIGHFAVWCEAFTVNFGHVVLPPEQVAKVPPSLKMLGVSPQSKLNCEVLLEDLAFEVRWAVAGDSVVVQLVAKLEDGEYMAFGISGDASHSQMVGGDVAVAWLEQDTLKGHAVDYYLDAKSQCAGVRGSCPDARLVDGTNSVRLLNAALVNGYSIVTYQRPLRAADDLDRPILTNASQPVIWAVGPLNSRNEVSYHSHFLKGDKFIEFGRPPVWNCPMPETEEEHKQQQRDPQQVAVIKPNPVPTPKPVPKIKPWNIPAIQCDEPEDGVFYAQMGPTGGKQGYPAITGHVGWGISWYINGLLIPEINVVRGRKYTFVVEGGSNPDVPARYHPFYITNDPVGGYHHKTDEEKQNVEIYAGVRRTRAGELIPTGVGRLCNWIHDSNEPEADDYPSFGAFQRSLTLVCEEGNPGVITWTPDKNTPNTVYYQCFTHRYLGWKINVLDDCDANGEESAPEAQIVQPASPQDPLISQESVQVVSRVKPDNNFPLDQRKKMQKIINIKNNDQDEFSNANRRPLGNVYERGSLTGEEVNNSPRLPHATSSGVARPTEYEIPISKVQIKQVIEAVESLESQLKNDLKKQQLLDTAQPVEFKGSFLPERPVRENEEYIVEPSRQQTPYMLPSNQKPLTLQTVLRPNGKPSPQRPYRRPTPPEIKLRRPQHQKPSFPLPMPGPQGASSIKKHSYKLPSGRFPSGMGRLPIGPMPPPPATMSSHNVKPNFHKVPPKTISKPSNGEHPLFVLGKSTMAMKTQTLTLGKSDIIGNQVVKGQITLPASNEPISLHSIPQFYVTKPGQIILGKPLENPQPLDQQMIQMKPQGIRMPSTLLPEPHLSSSTIRTHTEPDNRSALAKVNMKSSEFIRESTDISAAVIPAVNTGFKPDSVVIESGFKPIIREPLMAAEDKITDFDGTSNRREDTDVQEDYEEVPQYISNHAYPNEKQTEKQTETFEPMFIPSPPDHSLSTGDKTIEVFPSNHAKEQRHHPVYVKSESGPNELFSKQNMDKDVPDMLMEADRVNAHYLPPDPKTPERAQKISVADETFTTYDGKIVSAATLTSVPNSAKNSTKLFSSKLPANTELLLKTPQFGPFKGEIPSVIAKQLDTTQHGNEQSKKELFNTRTTHLKLINSLRSEDLEIESELKGEASEIHETKVESSEDGHQNNGEEEDYEDESESEEETKNRARREIKTKQFDNSTSEGTSTKPVTREINNQVDFDEDYLSNSSTVISNSNIISLLVLIIWSRCF